MLLSESLFDSFLGDLSHSCSKGLSFLGLKFIGLPLAYLHEKFPYSSPPLCSVMPMSLAKHCIGAQKKLKFPVQVEQYVWNNGWALYPKSIEIHLYHNTILVGISIQCPPLYTVHVNLVYSLKSSAQIDLPISMKRFWNAIFEDHLKKFLFSQILTECLYHVQGTNRFLSGTEWWKRLSFSLQEPYSLA